MRVRLTHIDGKLPNLALMKLSHWHKAQGDEVHFTRSLTREMFEPEYDRVYGSAIFGFSRDRVRTFVSQFDNPILGGTYSAPEWAPDESPVTVEGLLGLSEYEHYDYSLYPDFAGSIGFTARGCRLRCKFCVVPRKEGRPRSVNTIADLWRGEPHPKHLHLLDNDFFGQPREQWVARVEEIVSGGFRVWSTGRAAVAEGFSFVGIELEPEYAEIARARIAEYAPPIRRCRMTTRAPGWRRAGGRAYGWKVPQEGAA